MTSLERRAETSLWPLVEHVVRTHGLAGLAVAVVQDGEVALARGFGTRDVRTGAPVTPDTAVPPGVGVEDVRRGRRSSG